MSGGTAPMSTGAGLTPTPAGIPEMVATCVERQPDTCAVREPATGDAVTYRQLWSRSGRLASDLRRMGVRRGEVVAVDQGRSIGMVVAMLGIARAGAAYLPLDPQAPADRLAVILDEARARFVLPSAGTCRELPSHLRRVTVPAGAAGTAAATCPDVALSGDDPFYVNYTSGSTGRPKGVVVPHRAVVRLVSAPRFCTIEPGDRVANAANPAFDATTFELWNRLTSGGTVVVLPSVTDLRIDDWVELVRAEGVTTMFLTTSLFHMVARERPAAFRDLKTVVVGGEQLDLAAARRVLADGAPRRLVNGYGPTETTTFASYYDCTPESLAGLDRVPVGYALQGTRLHVLDEDLRPVPPGETGELCIGGPGVALGYLHRPDLTRERFVPEHGDPVALMYRTGDLARLLPHGAMELLGRRDRQIKLRGFRVELEEIERAIVATGLVDSAFVEKVGEGAATSLAAFVLPTSAGQAGALRDVLARELSTSLPAYMIPTHWVVLTELPYGPTGKVDRARLLNQLSEDRSPLEKSGGNVSVSAGGNATPLSVTRRVERIWKDVLGTESTRPSDNFLDLGGNSILAIQLASRLSADLTVDLEPTDVLLAESLAELRDRVEARLAGSPDGHGALA
jgi:amino acid adenylation domain-containing protein